MLTAFPALRWRMKARLPRPVALHVLLVALLCACADTQSSERSQSKDFTVLKAGDAAAPLPDNSVSGIEIELKGEQVCLRPKPTKDGRYPLVCAAGFRGDDDRFYGLRAADPTQMWSSPMARRVRITGKLVPSKDSRYEESGLIVYTNIQAIGDTKIVTGTFACLMHGVPHITDANECKPIVKTDGGLYWGLELQALKRAGVPLADGDRLSLEAEILEHAPDNWSAWASYWSRHRIEGVLHVTNLKRLPAQSH